MRVLVPWAGPEPGPPAMGVQSLSYWTSRELPCWFLIFLLLLFVFCPYPALPPRFPLPSSARLFHAVPSHDLCSPGREVFALSFINMLPTIGSFRNCSWIPFSLGTSGKEPACQCRRLKKCRFDPWVRKIPWRRKCNPLQYSCLENAMDRRNWWAAVHGVAKSWTTSEAI